MGNKDDLLRGAKQCLRQKGYANTTARDIAGVAGTSLAAIGYHYGSTRALMQTAMYSLIGEWSDQIQDTLRAEAPAGETYLQRFERIWERTIESFREDREMWAASLDALGAAGVDAQLQAALSSAVSLGRYGCASMFEDLPEDTISESTARTMGTVFYALMSGMAVQWLVDPDSAPSARELTDGLTKLANRIVSS